MQDDRVQLYLRPLKINKILSLNLQFTVTESLLHSLLQACISFEYPFIFQAQYTFVFFPFLRMSNVLPHTKNSFDPSRHLCRGDAVFTKTRVTILSKWSKSNRKTKQVQTLAIPKLGDSPISPIRALQHMIALVPGDPNDSLFMVLGNENVTFYFISHV